MSSKKIKQMVKKPDIAEESELERPEPASAEPETTFSPAQSSALLKAPMAGAQRQALASSLGHQYGNRQLQRMLNNNQQPVGGHPRVLEEEPTRPIGGGIDIPPVVIDDHDLTNQRFSGNPLLEDVFDGKKLVKKGMSTDPFRGISSIQLALHDLGHTVHEFGVDGVFGSETEKAVKSFQKAESLAVDGIVGKDTMGALDKKAPNGAEPVKPADPAPGGAVTVSDVTTGGPAFFKAGHFHWRIRWNHNAKNGFIIQEITNTYNAQNRDGSANNSVRPTPHYWEAWQVDGAGDITDIATSEGTDDYWIRPKNRNTKGNWAMDARVFFAPTLDPASNFGRGAAGGAPDAGDLFATTTQPTNLGASLATRHAGGTWDNTNGKDTHDPA